MGIEAKHTLWIDGGDSNLQKALKQVADVKKLPRKKHLFDRLPGGVSLHGKDNLSIKITSRKNWPEYRNSMFGCIISRHLKSSRKEHQNEINDQYFLSCIESISHDLQNAVDLIIGGENWLGLPTIGEEQNQTIDSPFHLPEQSKRAWFKNKNSFGVGICNLIRALNYIELAEINYSALIADGLDIPIRRAGALTKNLFIIFSVAAR